MQAKKIAFSLALILIVIIVGYAGYRFGGESIKIQKQLQILEQNKDVIYGDATNNVTSGTTENVIKEKTNINFDFSSYQIEDGSINTSTPYKKYSLPEGISSLIEWNEPTKIAPLGFFFIEQGVDRTDLNGENVITASDYFLIGTFDYNNKKGAVVLADIICEECFGGSTLPAAMFILYDNKVVFLEKTASESQSYYPPKDYLVRSSVFVDDSFVIPALDFKVVVEYAGKKYNLVPTDHDSPTIRTHGENIGAELFYTHPLYGPVYKLNSKFEILGKDGRSWYFQYRPEMVDNDNNFTVVFNNKTQNIYKYISPNGCGRMTDPTIASGIATSSLKDVGVAGGKYPVYINNDAVLLRQLYDSMYFPEGDGKISYEKFVADNPIVYFYDNFGRLIQATEKKFQPAAECGKPVIYLYPPTPITVRVKVELSHWSYSDPEYHNGWEVWAEPSGNLIETRTGKNYPYLFWEGTGVGEQPQAEAGFVVQRDEVPKFLSEKLAQLGLNQKESADFREFWEPRMTKAPYYFVTFYGTGTMNKIAPLTIEPKPETVIRILMDYRPLATPIMVKEQRLVRPVRHGFTVVEWGGVLGRE